MHTILALLLLTGVPDSELCQPHDEMQYELSLVEETVDQVTWVYEGKDRQYVTFARNDKVFTMRPVKADMEIFTDDQGPYLLWYDTGICHRVVRFNTLRIVHVDTFHWNWSKVQWWMDLQDPKP